MSDDDSNPSDRSWRGSSMAEIYRNLDEFELEHVAYVRPCNNHTVLHKYPIRVAANEPPQPFKGHHKWDATHVRLPCSPKSLYPVISDGSESVESRWGMIQQALLRPISTSRELEALILSYNTKYENNWSFRALHKLFEDELDESETRVFFEDLLPRIIRLALQLPELIQTAIPLLKQGQMHTVTLTQQQISCLLANAFLCTFPRRNTQRRKSEYSTFPEINFNRLFQSSGHQVLEKIKCIFHYFRRVCPTEHSNSNVPTGVVTFQRRSLKSNDMPRWADCEAPLSSTALHITAEGTIEDQGLGMLQVDFANKYLGGGVLGCGCVQEEIRFVICPELIISKLFTECLRPTEALLMVGCERFSNYSGYANTFQWAGNHDDATPQDSSRRRLTHIVAIDALHFVQSEHQYREELMLRELNKAYVGFLHTLSTPAPAVASGNWGCGAFGGEATLKALLQLMVCAATQRSLVYFTFGDLELRDEVYNMHVYLSERKVRVKELWATLRQFQKQKLAPSELYNFIYSCHRKPSERSQNTQHNEMASSSTSAAAAAAATNSKPCQANSMQQQKSSKGNQSRDLFASNSSSSAASEAEMLTAVDQTSTEKQSFENSEIDALLLTAAIAHTTTSTPETPTSTSNGKQSNGEKQSTPPAPPPTKRTEPRQRTLLEMLDMCYTDSSSPAVKRHCKGASLAKKN